MTEFLPLCDVLFNVISLAGYFCDVVFDVVLGYALFERGMFGYFATVMGLVIFSLLISQIVSIRWYWRRSAQKRLDRTITAATMNVNDINSNLDKKDIKMCSGSVFSYCIDPDAPVQSYAIIAIHSLQCGILWRYAKLFVPVDLSRIKHEVRDLCMLRLVHGFCEAAPMLLLQSYLLITDVDSSKINLKSEMKLKSLSGHIYDMPLSKNALSGNSGGGVPENTFKDLNIISAALSLFSVCWALASFSKNVRLQKIHRLVLTWLGVIFQFIWRLGTVSARVASLTVYASVYKYWVFLVIILHWFSMLLWIISPKNVFHGERLSKLRKTIFSSLIAFVYVFAYINLQELNHRQKMLTFYVVMFLENVLLVSLWMVGIWNYQPEQLKSVPLLILASFLIGVTFMLLYYRYFHVQRLNWESGGRYPFNENEISSKRQQKISKLPEIRSGRQPPITGVFHCRFTNPVGNAATKRKKKKPTTFIPPPTTSSNTYTYTTATDLITSPTNGNISNIFWRRPLTTPHSQAGSSETEGSVGSRINIYQKLQEKKQKQLAELKMIEEEIKQGKLGGNVVNSSGDDARNSLPRQPIPKMKKHINLDTIDLEKSYTDFDELNNLNKYSTAVTASGRYDTMYSSFGLSGINIPAVEKNTIKTVPESTSLTRPPPTHSHRAKIPHNLSCNLMLENCRAQNQRPPRNSSVFDQIKHQNIFHEINHPRQISGTYSSTERNTNKDIEGLPFPYNVVPPPRSKLDSRFTPPTTPAHKATPASEFRHKSSERRFRTNGGSKTPEIVLAPHYLEGNSRMYYEWANREHMYRPHGNMSSGDENLDLHETVPDDIEGNGDHQVPSDLDSQISIPRSYTLPREFKYYRRSKPRKSAKQGTDFIFRNNTNGSDGDVDSGDDNESDLDSDRSNTLESSHSRIALHSNMRLTPNSFHNHHISNTKKNHYQPPQRSPENQIPVNNFDLINGVSGVRMNGTDSVVHSYSHFPNRLRGRTIGLVKHNGVRIPYPKHETKL